MAYLLKHFFFSNGWTNGLTDKPTNRQTDERTDGRAVRFYYAPNFIWGHKNIYSKHFCHFLKYYHKSMNTVDLG